MKKKRKYTKKMHIYRTKQMLKSKNYVRGGSCPAAPSNADDGHVHYSVLRKRDLWTNIPCRVCRECADIKERCPCIRLGEEESIRRLFGHEKENIH